MSRLRVPSPTNAQLVVHEINKDLERRVAVSPPGLCPIEVTLALLKYAQVQTCGKCVPCRIGLRQLENKLESILYKTATMEDYKWLEWTASSIVDSADCAIGAEAARIVHKCIVNFKDDFVSHIRQNRCRETTNQPVPCVSLCPAGVEVPSYIACIKAGRYADAVRVICKDNPFPTTCGYICENPCENHCRRMMVDDAINIRGLKRFAVDNACDVAAPENAESTGKKVAIIGGGPAGLTAAYFLSLMGHGVTVYEKRKKLGGMLRYGIPNYRLPRVKLECDVDRILSTGIEVKTGVEIGRDVTLASLRAENDAVYIAIGAHNDKKIGIPGEDCNGVFSAVELLRGIGDEEYPDFTGKNVVVIGGGNVAMDVTRTSVRLGAKKVTCVYRRRQVDMTALPGEIEGAIAEGAELITLQAPVKVECDENNNAVALWVHPQIVGKLDSNRRPSPVPSKSEDVRIPADLIIVAVGQGIESRDFEKEGITVKRGIIDALDTTEIINKDGFFAGGDCVTGPATVIRAIAAGKVAAANIDDYLGFCHTISLDVDVPLASPSSKPAMGRVNIVEREAGECRSDFSCVECAMTHEAAMQESDRCLRCDTYGFGSFRGGEVKSW